MRTCSSLTVPQCVGGPRPRLAPWVLDQRDAKGGALKKGITMSDNRKKNAERVLNASKKAERLNLVEKVAGKPTVSDEVRQELRAGVAPSPTGSGGVLCTVSGECNGGSSCWDPRTWF